ncbi:efflux RND transporter periplasmic adaptor subunit [Vibrio sp. YMD68]|uniref:efflux RND transporter periplasmic adaptor subunit n=1 Tax=Vibrio sp. YMD68 TaxID=3042300 RepID=UPI00249AAD57|nr:efflux RND transporter periplasmic adaptor subunit [Vibrio sp. YMD68]WGV98857.1 efflux RND transporter periplasmic adaptor subunit [Vibrio sp. YMD68]
MKTVKLTLVALLVGGVIGYAGSQYLQSHVSNGHDMAVHGKTDPNDKVMSDSTATSSNEPLYWVAPMDPNYQRDKPGKSPMGMDLVPVYADDGTANNDKPGTVTIDSAVENNLGVKTEIATMEPLEPRIETVGYVAFDESLLWQTNVRTAGWVEKLYINAVGERVNKGEVLFTFYSPDLVKAQEELLSAYQSGRRGLVNGATERLISLGVDRAQIKQIVSSGKASQTIDIKAVAHGVIASLNIREGGYISPAQSVISAGPIDEVWVDAEVFERQAEWMIAGSDATMTLDAISGKTWQGKIDYVYPILDPKTRTLRVRLKFSNPNGELKPNMFANIALQPVTNESVLTIPRSSVIRSGGMSRIVLALGEGKYRSARIDTGREAGDRIEVLAGLTEQDRVVTSAHFMLDSESSLSADLSRINGVESTQPTVWTTGEITNVMADHNMLTINHQPVPEWNWPGMTMDFNLAQTIDMSALKVGQGIDFEMQKNESGQYEIIDLNTTSAITINEVWVEGDITMLMPDFGMVTLKHTPVEAWQWQAGEMNFSVEEGVDLSGFIEGQSVRFLVIKQGSDYALKALESKGGRQ